MPENDSGFKKVPTMPLAVIQLLLCCAQIVLVFILPEICDRDKECASSTSFSILIYTHGAHWAIILVIDQILHYYHHRSRLQGYLEFYIKTKNARRAPFYIISAGNAVLMITVIILHDICDNSPDCSTSFTKLDSLRGLITLESLVVMCLVVSYIIRLREFNKNQLPPDVLREDIASSLIMGGGAQAVGFMEQSQVMEVMEMQAEMIRYLQEHSVTLGQKILELTRQLSQKERA